MESPSWPVAFVCRIVYTKTIPHLVQCQDGVYTVTERTKSAQVNLRIRPQLKEAAEKAAADDQRSLTSLIEKLLTNYLRDNGYLTK